MCKTKTQRCREVKALIRESYIFPTQCKRNQNYESFLNRKMKNASRLKKYNSEFNRLFLSIHTLISIVGFTFQQ